MTPTLDVRALIQMLCSMGYTGIPGHVSSAEFTVRIEQYRKKYLAAARKCRK